MSRSRPIPSPDLSEDKPSSAYAQRAKSNQELFERLPRNDSEWLAMARAVEPDRSARMELWSLLSSQWNEIDLTAAAQESIALLAEAPTAAVVMVGQQPALAGGTLLHLSKALSAGVLAQRLRDQGEPAVALLWVADEDHDVGELFGGFHPRGDGLPEVTNPFERHRLMIERLRLPGVDSLLTELRALRVESAPWFADLERTKSESPATWYRDFMLSVLAELPVLPVHATWIRPLQRQAFAEELAKPGALRQEVAQARKTLEQQHVSPPIPEADPLPLFFVDDEGARHRLDLGVDGETASLRGSPSAPGFPAERMTLDALASLALSAPARFSPDALLRPLIQDRLFEPVGVVTGPTEMAYQLELIESYRARRIRRPVPFHRLRARIVSEAEQAALDEFEVDAMALAADSDVTTLLPSIQAQELQGELLERARPIGDWLSSLVGDDRCTPPLKKRAERLARKLDSDIEKLHSAIRREVAGDAESARKRLSAVLAALWVRKQPAERVVSVLEYSRRFSAALLPALIAAYDPYDERERMIVLPEHSRVGSSSLASESGLS